MIITNDMLYKCEYNIENLIENIENLNLNVILNTQKLTIPFCVNYILEIKYQIEQDEKYITISDIINKQQHIKKEELIEYIVDPNN